MRKLISFMHVSVDGFAAGTQGEMDWIHVDNEIFDYAGVQTDHADAALYGRITFEMMDAYWPTAGDDPGASKHDKHHSSWYNSVQKIVLSHTMKIPGSPNTKIIGENFVAEINQLKEQPGKNILVFGSPGAVRSLLAEDLIDEIWLFVNPVILGRGISYLSGDGHAMKLVLQNGEIFSSGVVCLHYVRAV